jgi:hypothetical protein
MMLKEGSASTDTIFVMIQVINGRYMTLAVLRIVKPVQVNAFIAILWAKQSTLLLDKKRRDVTSAMHPYLIAMQADHVGPSGIKPALNKQRSFCVSSLLASKIGFP